jgi:ubiquinone/menaquinone biosynthesis C-methylase UbiE
MDDLVRRMNEKYDLGAEAYTRYIAPAMQPARARLLTELRLDETHWLLDVGAGDGVLAREFASRDRGPRHVAIDLSMGMLGRAMERPFVLPVRMDMRRLGFAGSIFDAAILAFVLFHFPEISEGLGGVRRVVKPGGWVGTLTFGERPGFAAQRVWKQELARAGAPLNLGVDLAPVDQVGATDRPEKVERLLENAGFLGVRAWSEVVQHRWEPEEYLSAQIGFGSSRRIFESLESEHRRTLLRRLRDRLHDLSADGLLYRPEVVFALGRVPQRL